ncbi:MAG TPA: class I SAM-dependent methyltransferase [Thermoanaerobaculia bacterium]|nr:class I SAM-dependent methyltransferase [Thermoanaerobaculia bacterium]
MAPDDDPSVPPDYGLDAPAVVRNLLLCGTAGLLLFTSKAAGLWPAAVAVGPVRFELADMGLFAGTGCLAMGFWMLWSSKFGKIRRRERLLDHLSWTGRERVLDVGCGRGLMLVGAAKRLTSGTATGIDIWQAEDLSGNRPAAALENARREGVAGRVEIRTADMRQIPLPDASIDRVVSCAAIHNIYAADERARALAEIARVLAPGGQVMLDDIRHPGEYAAALAAGGCTDVQRVDSRLTSAFLALVTMGSLRPGTVVARKNA